MKCLIVAIIAALVLPVPFVPPAAAQVTAADVVDRENLRAFVHAAKEYAEIASTEAEYQKILEEFRTEETWRKGSVYLFISTTESVILFHAGFPELGG